MNDRMKEILCGLHEITLGCRADMHEPDEQNLKATIVGTHLDNAFGPLIDLARLRLGQQEIVVILHREGEVKHRSETINLCDLIALARMAIGAAEWETPAKTNQGVTEAVRVLRRGLEEWDSAWNGLTERHHMQSAVNLKKDINEAIAALTGELQPE